jgi:hypothetical protein
MHHYECGFLLVLLSLRRVQNDRWGSLKHTLEEFTKGNLCGEHAARVSISFRVLTIRVFRSEKAPRAFLKTDSQREIFQSPYPLGSLVFYMRKYY